MELGRERSRKRNHSPNPYGRSARNYRSRSRSGGGGVRGGAANGMILAGIGSAGANIDMVRMGMMISEDRLRLSSTSSLSSTKITMARSPG